MEDRLTQKIKISNCYAARNILFKVYQLLSRLKSLFYITLNGSCGKHKKL